ncbi:MAG: PQQ-dependent sugar dehydrogenase [Breznakibacter sp.]
MKKYMFFLLPVAAMLAIGFIWLSQVSQQKKQVSARENFERYCSGCHGMNMERFAGKTYAGVGTDYLSYAIKEGLPMVGMPSFTNTFTGQEIKELSEYMLTGIKKRPKENTNASFPEAVKSQRLNFRVDTVATGLDVPWGIAFLPDGDMLVTERSGQLFRFRNGKLAGIVENVPAVFNRGQGGLSDIILHPQYDKNGWIYLAYAQPSESGNMGNTAVMRVRLKNDKLIDHQMIFKAEPDSDRGYHFGARMVFDDKGYLYVTVGDRGNQSDAQSLDSYSGKVHRLFDDGRIPEDNPFVGDRKAIPSIFTYGHRNPQGIAIHPVTREIWANEHGPKGGDEINIIQRGKNYGWPEITYGINYNGTQITPYTSKSGMEQPIHQWTPSIAPSSLAFVTGDKYPEWQGDVMSGSLSFRYLERDRIEGTKLTESEKLIENAGRVRHVTMGPDGYIYVAIEQPGVVIKLVPLR